MSIRKAHLARAFGRMASACSGLRSPAPPSSSDPILKSTSFLLLINQILARILPSDSSAASASSTSFVQRILPIIVITPIHSSLLISALIVPAISMAEPTIPLTSAAARSIEILRSA